MSQGQGKEDKIDNRCRLRDRLPKRCCLIPAFVVTSSDAKDGSGGTQMISDGRELDRFKELTWKASEEWAGSRILSRGQSYHRSGRVDELAATPAGSLIATVRGGNKYTTLVEFQEGELTSRCTCPYGESCKHAVAVVLDYLEKVKKRVEVPTIDARDKRLGLLAESHDDFVIEDAQDVDSTEEDEIDYRETSAGRGRKDTSSPIKAFLENMTKDELLGLLLEAAQKYPSFREDLLHRQHLSKGDVKNVVAAVRKEIRSLSAEPAWRNHWNDEGHIPDYSRVRNRLETLLSAGHADAVITLGKELLDAGIQQVEMSHDEGETVEEISSCLAVVFSALSRSSLSPVEQMLWVIDAELEDDYDLCQGSKYFWEERREASHWSAVADDLRQRLNRLSPSRKDDDFSRNYKRDRLIDRLIEALENAGRPEEVIALCEQEAVKTGNYNRLVDILLRSGRKDDAEQWIFKGIDAASKGNPSTAHTLVNTLREIREKEKNWPSVAAIRADEFFSGPSFAAYDALRHASKLAGAWAAVRKMVLLYLETGKLPFADVSWPLPEAEAKIDRPSRQDKLPMVRVLIEIAMDEKQPDEVIKWYDFRGRKGSHFQGWGGYNEDHIAQAIEKAYPERAAAIWKSLAEGQIAQTKPAAYEVAARYLKKLRDLMTGLDKEEEWRRYLAGLRQANARKPRLLQTLATLEGRKIIDGRE